MSTEEWDKRLTDTRERMNQFVMQGVEEAARKSDLSDREPPADQETFKSMTAAPS